MGSLPQLKSIALLSLVKQLSGPSQAADTSNTTDNSRPVRRNDSISSWFKKKWLHFQLATPIYVLEPWEVTLFWLYLIVLFTALVYGISLVLNWGLRLVWDGVTVASLLGGHPPIVEYAVISFGLIIALYTTVLADLR